MVAFEDVGAFDPEFAGVAGGEFGGGGGHVFCGLVGQEGTYGADCCAPLVPGLGVGEMVVGEWRFGGCQCLPVCAS